MAPKKGFSQVGNTRRARLYSIVFSGKLSTLVVFMLLAAFLTQPFHKVMASEIAFGENETTEITAEDVRVQEEVVETVPEVQPEEVVPAPSDSATSTSDEGTESGADVGDVVVVETGTTTESVSDSNDETVVDDTEEEVTDPVDEVPPIEEDTEDTSSIENTTEENSVIQELAQETVRQIENIVNDQNYYQFSKQECVSVGNGSFHCSTNEGSEFDNQSVVYTDKGANGNLEVFLKTSLGKVKQMTDNEYDDASPHYDPKSKRVVWQRLINDRNQIVMYDINEDKEYQLTFSKTNNMEPKVSADGIVWQAWDNNDWEIMYFDGETTEQITDNTAQDVAPVIEDGYILWSVLGKENQAARVYSIEKGETLSIEGHEGGSIVNPRFVLVYDTKFENGDVITQGFDPTTGLSAPIAAQPAPEPINIPTPDPIGEIRALINNKSSHKDEFVPSDNGHGNGATSTSSDSGANADDSLNLKSPNNESGAPAVLDASVSLDFELTEYDLVITDTASSAPRSRATIESELEKEISTRMKISSQD
jgi:hypothetical protein